MSRRVILVGGRFDGETRSFSSSKLPPSCRVLPRHPEPKMLKSSEPIPYLGPISDAEIYVLKHLEFVQGHYNHDLPPHLQQPMKQIVDVDYYLHHSLSKVDGINNVLEQALKQALGY